MSEWQELFLFQNGVEMSAVRGAGKVKIQIVSGWFGLKVNKGGINLLKIIFFHNKLEFFLL